MTTQLAVAGLVNTAVVLTVAQADSMQRTVIRALARLAAGRPQEDTLRFCAVALKSLTVLENVRVYLDEDTVNVAMDVMTSCAVERSETVAFCAAAIFNCIALKPARWRAIERHVVAECRRIVDACDADVRYSCIMLLAELAKHQDVTERLLEDGVLHMFSVNLCSTDARLGEDLTPCTCAKRMLILRHCSGLTRPLPC